MAPNSNQHHCSSCNAVGQNLRRCSSCLKTYYCSRSCQIADWRQHKMNCSPPCPGRILAGKKVPQDESGGAIDEWRERFMFPVATSPDKIKSSLYLMVDEEEFSQKPSPLMIIPGCELYSEDDRNDAKCDYIAAVLAFVQAVPPIRALLRNNENEVGNIIDKLIQGERLTEDESFGIFNELDLVDWFVLDSMIGDAVSCIHQMYGYYQSLVEETDEPVPPICSICLDELDDPYNKVTLQCGHSLHNKCLKQILAAHPKQPKCPICRYDLPPTKLSVQICIPPNGIVGVSEDEHIITFVNNRMTWQIKKQRNWKVGNVEKVVLNTNGDRLFYQATPLETSLNSIIRRKIIAEDERGYKKNMDSLIATNSTTGCAVCNSGGCGRVELANSNGRITLNATRQNETRQTSIVLESSCSNKCVDACNFCMKTRMGGTGGGDAGGAWYFDTAIQSWKVVTGIRLPGARDRKVHYLTLPTVLVVDVFRHSWDASGQHYSFAEVDFPLNDFDLAPFLACDPCPDVVSMYDLRFMLNLEPQSQYGKIAKKENSTYCNYERVRGRYIGHAKACDDLWYSFDVCNPTKRAPKFDTAKRMVSSTAMLLVYVRKDCQ